MSDEKALESEPAWHGMTLAGQMSGARDRLAGFRLEVEVRAVGRARWIGVTSVFGRRISPKKLR